MAESEEALDECKKLILSSATERDPNRRLELSHDLSVFLTKPGGLLSLFSSVIDFDTSSQKLTTHNQRFLAIAAIITRLPRICISYDDYCTNLMKQLKPILKSENPLYTSLASIIVKAIIDSPHSTGDRIVQIVLNPILNGLTQAQSSYSCNDSIVVIHNLIVNGISPKYVLKVFPQLFYALARLYATPSSLKSLIKTSLTSIINDLMPGAACCLLEKTLFHDRSVLNYVTPYLDEQEISIQVSKESTDTNMSLETEVLARMVLDLIQECDNEPLTLEFFFHFQECMWNKGESDAGHFSAILIEPLLNDTVEEKSTKLDLSSIIATNHSRCLHLVHRTLLNYLSKIKYSQRDLYLKINQELEVQSIKTCLNILEVLLCLTQVNNQIQFNHDNFILVLKEMKEELETKNPNSGIIPDLSAILKKIQTPLAPDGKVASRFLPKTEDELSSILRDLNDKIVPVQVHALIRLKQMIISNDKETVLKIPQLFTTIAAFLEHHEPYVFLACIGLVAEMALRKTDYIMPKLIQLHERTDLQIQNRINIGEVLIRLLKQLNQAAPIYAKQVISSLIKSSRDEEDLIRMSSLTNLGELCRNLKDSLGIYILDVLSTVELVLSNDTVQVKTAAIDLLRTTLSGLNRLTIESIQKDLKSIYDLLKKTKNRTFDEHLCLQADLALDEMDRLARELLVGTDDGRLIKNLRVLTLD